MIGIPRPCAPRVLFTLLLLGAPAAAQKSLQGVGEEVAPDAAQASPDAVLLINGDEVPAEAYARWLIEEVGPPLMKEFAVDWEIGQQAEALGLAADEAQIQAALDKEIDVRVQGAFRGERAGWVAELQRLGRSVDGHRRQRSTELEPLLDAFNMAAKDRVVPEAKIQRDWELFYGPRGRAFELDMIKIPIVVQMPEDKPSREAYERARENARSSALEQALGVRARLQAGEDFATLVNEIGGDAELIDSAGYVQRFSQFGWPSDFVSALFDLERGGYSEPLSGRGGWWIVHLRDFVDTPLESVRAELTQRLIERGPEQDEVGSIWARVSESLQLQVQPGMYAADARVEEGADATALLVNGKPVSRKTVARWLLHTRGESTWAQFTEEWLLARRARELGIGVTPEEVEASVEAHFQRILDESYKGDRGMWRAYQEMSGSDPEALMRQLARRRRQVLLAEKVMLAERVVTPEMVRDAYHQRFGEVGRRVQARVLLLEIPTPSVLEGMSKEQVDELMSAAVDTCRKEAQALAARARNGEDFATLVRQYSQDAISRELDGVLKGGFRPDGWSGDVSTAVMGLPRGAISDALQEGRYMAVFEILEFEEVPFESVRAELEAELRERKPAQIEIAAFRNVMLQGADVQLLPGLRE